MTRDSKTLSLKFLAWMFTLCLTAAVAHAREWQVSTSAAAGGDGSAARPFHLIQDAVDRAQGGDTIVVQSGVYRQNVTIKKAYADGAPLTIRAADGAQPVITGMEPITGWKTQQGGIYVAEAAGKIGTLFTGAERVAIARWPRDDQPWLKVTGLDAATKSLSFSGEVSAPAQTRGLKAYVYEAGAMDYSFHSLQNLKIEGAGGSFTLGEKSFAQLKKNKAQRLAFFNAPEFVREPGECAFEALDGDRTRIYFKPRRADDTARTAFRKGAFAFKIGDRSANVRISGFVISGMNGTSLSAQRTKNLTVENCVFTNNESAIGIALCSKVLLRRCAVVQNYFGIGVSKSDDVTLEQCEIALSDEDGFRANGREYDTKSGKIGVRGLRFVQCYFHHHFFQGHPDNVQFFRGVGSGSFDRCLFLFGGQQIMAEQTEDYRLSNSTVLASINRAMNLFTYGKADKPGWNLENNTVGFTRYNPVVSNGPNGRSQANLFFKYNLPVTYNASGLQADHDWFWPLPGVKKFSTVSEANAKRDNPRLRNVPEHLVIAWGSGGSSRDRLKLDAAGKATELFAVGDLVEVNGDGIARKVTAVDADAITISPALPAPPFRYSFVFNWKANANFQLDARPAEGSPLLTAGPDGKAVGSSLHIAHYQKGDFDGDGARDLPPLPQELADILTERLNNYIYPYALP